MSRPAKDFERLTLATARVLRADLQERVIRGLVSEETRRDLDELDAALAAFAPANAEPVNEEAVRADLVAAIDDTPKSAEQERAAFNTAANLSADLEKVQTELDDAAHDLEKAMAALVEIDELLPASFLPGARTVDRVKALLALHEEAVFCLSEASRLYSSRALLANAEAGTGKWSAGQWINRTREALRALPPSSEQETGNAS